MITATTPAQLLRSHGLRATAGRIALLQLVLNSHAPVSPAGACQALQAAGLPAPRSSVYRELAAMAAAGAIHQLPLPTPAYERAGMAPHGHAYCTSCKRVDDIPLQPTALAGLQQAAGHSGLHHGDVILAGLCGPCHSDASCCTGAHSR